MAEKRGGESSTIRAFIAIEISGEVRRALDEFIGELKSGGGDVKWVRAASIHLTLKFLGDIPRSLIPDVSDAMKRAAGDTAALEIHACRTGAFPGLKRPRVLWAGLEEKTGELAQLAGRLDKELRSLGFEAEKRAFKPHLTLGRVRRGGKLKGTTDILTREAGRSFGNFIAGELILFRSELRPEGALYSKLEVTPLA